MADTTFTAGTTVASTWLQDANDHTYDKGAGVKHTASKISVTPAATITSTNVQAALEELSGEITTVVADILDGAVFTGDVSVPSLNGGALAGHRNKLINGCFSVNQRGSTSVADDVYCLDRWYVLTETGNVTVAQLSDPEVGAINGIQLTQPDASPKRMGFAQIIESRNIKQFASTAMNLSARLRLSIAGNIRYAVIEHTGTADTVTSDVVSNWASATFTPSNFFIAGVNIIDTGTLSPGAGVWGTLSDSGSLGASIKNVIIFIWTESQVAQNTTLSCSRIQYEPGTVATPHEWRMAELLFCQRYYFKTFPYATAPAQNAGLSGAFLTTSYTTGGGGGTLRFPVELRTAATPTTYNPSALNTNWRDITNSTDRAIGASAAYSTSSIDLRMNSSAAGAAYNFIHLVIDSEL